MKPFVSRWDSAWFILVGAVAIGAMLAMTPRFAHGSDRPADDHAYVATRVENVRGGVIYGIDIQPDTHDIYIASETMRGGFFGAAHGPANGTWRSDDQGETWNRIGPGGSNVQVSHQDPRVIYANDRFGVYKTIDGGETWDTILPGGEGYRLGYRGLAIGKSDHDVVYAGGRGYLRISRDGGETWLDRALPEKDGHVAWTQVIQVHPHDADTAFFAFYDGKGPQGVWKTTDAGETFTQLHDGSARAMAIAPGDPDTIYCSSAVTHDGGETWQPVQAMAEAAWMITVHPADADVAYYSRPGRPVYGTIDGGRIFHQIQGVMPNYDATEVEGMAIDAQHDVLWVGGDRIWKGVGARRGRIRLEEKNQGFHVLSMTYITSVATGVWAASDAQGIHYTTDGHTWHTTAMGMHGRDAMWRVTPSPSHPDVVYAGHERRLFKSVDAGKTWFMIHDEWYPYTLVDPADPDIVYVSSHRAQGVMMRSTNGGRSFENLGEGRFVAVRPGSPGTIYIEREDGFYVSHDRAESLDKISDESVSGFLLSTRDPDLMLSARAQGLFRSTDAGRTWHRLDVELSRSTRMGESGDGSLWLSTADHGLRRSTDRGDTWQPVWEAHGVIAADPWDERSIYMTTRGGIFHIHPPGAGRTERLAQPPTDDAEHQTIDIDGPRFLNRSNTTYRLTRDVDMFGIERSVAMLPRGVRNITLDGQGHTVRYTQGPAIFGDDIEHITIENLHFVPRDPDEPLPDAIIHLTNSRHVTIRNCTFEIPGTGRLGSGKAISTVGILTNNVAIEACTATAPQLRGYLVQGTGRHTIRGCTFVPRDRAVQLRYADGSILKDNDFGDGEVSLLATDDVSR